MRSVGPLLQDCSKTTALAFLLTLFVVFSPHRALGQGEIPCQFELDATGVSPACQQDLPTEFTATPLIDGNSGLSYGDPDNNIVSLYGGVLADAYVSERLMGKIMRYLKCCKANGAPRYANLKQVFITSRIYGGYATPANHGCTVNPEPFAYESGIAVQRLIVAQIKQAAGVQTNDPHSGAVDYSKAPWFDWGPYLWASGITQRSDGLNWCNGQIDSRCHNGLDLDVRYGDPNDSTYWGDFTHPSAKGAEKVANQLLIFIGKDPNHVKPGSPFVTPWIGQ